MPAGTGAIAEPDTARAQAPDAGPAGRYDAFISYARKDTAFAVERLSRSLGARGQEVWLDVEDIPGGAKWRDRVRRGIEACKAFVFVISPDSVSSTQCLDEIEDAVALNKLIVPVVYRDAPEGSLPPAVAEAEWVFLRDEDEMAAGVDRLVDALETDLQWRDEHTRLAGRVREWTDAQRDRSYLLRRADLREAEAWLGRQDGHKAAPTREQGEFVARSRQAAARRLYTIIGALAAGLAIAMILAVLALIQRQSAINATHQAQSRLLAEQAHAPPTSDWQACSRSSRIESRRRPPPAARSSRLPTRTSRAGQLRAPIRVTASFSAPTGSCSPRPTLTPTYGGGTRRAIGRSGSRSGAIPVSSPPWQSAMTAEPSHPAARTTQSGSGV